MPDLPAEFPDEHVVLAYDPGLKMGWAVAGLTRGKVESGQAPLLEALEGAEDLIGHHAGERYLHVVSEAFVITAATARKSSEHSALDGIGALRYLVWKYLRDELTLQTAASAKRFATDEKLKILGWWHPTPGGHANDALRHLLLYTVNKRLINPGRLLRQP